MVRLNSAPWSKAMLNFVKDVAADKWIREKKPWLSKNGFKAEMTCRSTAPKSRRAYRWCLFSRSQLQRACQTLSTNTWRRSLWSRRKKSRFTKWSTSQQCLIWKTKPSSIKNRAQKLGERKIPTNRTQLFQRKTRHLKRHHIINQEQNISRHSAMESAPQSKKLNVSSVKWVGVTINHIQEKAAPMDLLWN